MFTSHADPSTGDSQRKWRRWSLAAITCVLLLIVSLRILRLSLADRDIHVDEVWSVWQLLGPQTDYTRDATWPPLYEIVLDGWQRLTGINIITVRMLGVLVSLLGASALYRVVQRMIINASTSANRSASQVAAFLAPLAWAAIPLSTFLASFARGYTLVYSLFPLTFWLTLRYFDRPTWRRGLMLTLSMVAMFYTAYGSIGAFLLLGIYTLIVYRMQIWRWWLPAIVGGALAYPAIRSIFGLSIGRTSSLEQVALPPLPTAISDIFKTQLGASWLLWLGLIALSAVALIFRKGAFRPPVVALILWVCSPLLFYVTNRWLGLFAPIYLWFVVLGLALLVAWGVALWPRIAQVVGVGAVVVSLIMPVDYVSFTATPQPLGVSFEALAKQVRWGDVLAIDPQWQDRYCKCIEPEVINYFIRLYFPQGWQIVDDPTGYRRVWYLKWDSVNDAAYEKRIREGRLASVFVGPPEALFRLYEAPPNPTGVLFENGLRFHGIEVIDEPSGILVKRAGDRFRVKLWWSVDRQPSADYSIGLQGYLAGNLVIQSDSGPQLADPTQPAVTSQWVPGQFYVEVREITVPRSISSGTLNAKIPIYLTVYQWWDGLRIRAAGMNTDNLLETISLYIKAWG